MKLDGYLFPFSVPHEDQVMILVREVIDTLNFHERSQITSSRPLDPLNRHGSLPLASRRVRYTRV